MESKISQKNTKNIYTKTTIIKIVKMVKRLNIFNGGNQENTAKRDHEWRLDGRKQNMCKTYKNYECLQTI